MMNSKDIDPWLEGDVTDSLDENIELELEDTLFNRDIAQLYSDAHPDAMDRRIYLRG